MTSRHKTYKGKEFNMSAFSEKNADTRAVSNINMNARGDVLDRQGHVKVSANRISQAFSANNNKKVRQVSLKDDAQAAPVANKAVVPDTKLEDTADPTTQVVSRKEIETPEGPAYEVEYADGSMEIIPIKL
jgi:hypothetical protein